MQKTVDQWIEQGRQGLAALGVERIRELGILPGQGEKFFPVIGYPPLTMFKHNDETALFENFAQRPENPLIAYLHIPFCPTRCTFCHWITKTKSKSEEVDVYIDYLIREMALYKTKMGLTSIPARSVLWGGGTPTYPNPKQLERLLEAFTTHFDLSSCTQFSVEAEPTTLLGKEGKERLRVLKDYGVDRISLGVQSFDDHVLKYMARAHDNEQTVQSIKNMRDAGFENISIDLIYGYPGQTVANWVQNLLTAADLDIEGWQLYRLRIKQHGDRPGNIIRVHEKKPEQFVGTDETWQMKYLGKMISEELGYGEHLRRVFSRQPDEISHYLRDWTSELTDVAGVGVSSWSNLRGVFTQNVGDQSLDSYYQLIDQGKVSVNRGKVRSEDDELRRSFLLPLKNKVVNKALYKERTGREATDVFADEIAWFKEQGLIQEDEKTISLTAVGGFFADEVATQFFNPDYLPFPEVARAARRRNG